MKRTARGLWLMAGLACPVIVHLCGAYFSRSGQGTDFPDFYCAARMVGSGWGHRLYDLSAQWQFQARLVGRIGSPFIHPPFEALLFLPVSYFSLRTAYLMWSGLNLLGLGVAAWQLRVRLATRASAPILGLLFLGFTPVTLNLVQGQDSILLLLAFTLAFCPIEGQGAEGGLWLGLGLIKFQFVIPAVLILVMRRGRKWAIGFVAAAAALILVSIAISGTAVVTQYPRFLLDLERVRLGGIHANAMPNLRGLCALAFRGSTRTGQGAWIVLSLIVLALGLDAWRRAGADAGKRLLAVSSTVLAAILLSYHANPHDLTLLLIPLTITFSHLRAPGARASRWWLPLLLTAVVLALPPVYVLGLRAHLFSPLGAGVLVLYGLTYMEVRSDGLSGTA